MYLISSSGSSLRIGMTGAVVREREKEKEIKDGSAVLNLLFLIII